MANQTTSRVERMAVQFTSREARVRSDGSETLEHRTANYTSWMELRVFEESRPLPSDAG